MTILEDVKKLNFSKGEYAVVGGGVICVHGIRPHQDIDLIVTKRLFKKLKNNGWQNVLHKKNVLRKDIYEVDADYRYGEYQPDQEE